MIWKVYIPLLLILGIYACESPNQPAPSNLELRSKPKGTLFIIGGGSRPPHMMAELVKLGLSEGGYALIFSQASAEPDTSFFYIKDQLSSFTDQEIIHLDSLRLSGISNDSIINASLIYITGGDQNRFMQTVPPTTRDAIVRAYEKGAVVAGTSAGAALMGKTMITGDQILHPEYESTYSVLEKGNAVYSEGLGLLDSIIVDQHFVARSRYNRAISALADQKTPLVAGVEEATAWIITPTFQTVLGEGQVMIFHRPMAMSFNENTIGFNNLRVDAYLQGDTFQIKNQP